MSTGAVIIGCSAGGLDALEIVLSALPVIFPVPIIIVQHQPAGRCSQLAELLGRHCLLPVKEADEKEAMLPGHVYTAPPNYHLLIERDRTFAFNVDEEVNHSRPSIEVAFESAADVFGAKLVGVILTGASSDGSVGLRRIETVGGLTIVQEPNGAHMATMPEAAIAATRHAKVLPLSEIGPYLTAHFRAEGCIT